MVDDYGDFKNALREFSHTLHEIDANIQGLRNSVSILANDKKHHDEALTRAFGRLDEHNERIRALEQARWSTNWIEKFLYALISGGLTYALTVHFHG